MKERFLARVEKHEDGCWLWTGPICKDGYGSMYYSEGSKRSKKYRAHRRAYELFVGPIPEDREIHHVCEERSCVNPDHLRAVTRAEHARVSFPARKTHCKNGHEFTPENTYYPSRGDGRYRECRACKSARNRAYYETHKVAA